MTAMALTRDFKETIRARVKRDPGFGKAHLREGIENFLSGQEKIRPSFYSAVNGSCVPGISLAVPSLGKQSPVHFFWGSFDLCCTRFSSRGCPPRRGIITSKAYSRECSSLGWWPGGGDVAGPAFYAYTVPEPAGYGAQPVRPEGAFYQKKLHEFLLMYDDVRRATSPHDEILEFAQSTYDAGANLCRTGSRISRTEILIFRTQQGRIAKNR